MSKRQQARVQTRTETRTSIWLALAAALALHALLLFLPLTGKIPVTESSPAQIELQLTTFSPQPPAPEVPLPQPETQLPEPMIESREDIVQRPSEALPREPPTNPAVQITEQEVRRQDEQKKKRLASVILSRQFITEESAADRIFGKPLRPQQAVMQEGFHFPARQNMIAMLDQPMPDLPFAYTPGLVHFAYDPGVRGDLQRFWDVITPEFGWRTNNGTEFRCVLLLVIVGCGWK